MFVLIVIMKQTIALFCNGFTFEHSEFAHWLILMLLDLQAGVSLTIKGGFLSSEQDALGKAAVVCVPTAGNCASVTFVNGPDLVPWFLCTGLTHSHTEMSSL